MPSRKVSTALAAGGGGGGGGNASVAGFGLLISAIASIWGAASSGCPLRLGASPSAVLSGAASATSFTRLASLVSRTKTSLRRGSGIDLGGGGDAASGCSVWDSAISGPKPPVLTV